MNFTTKAGSLHRWLAVFLALLMLLGTALQKPLWILAAEETELEATDLDDTNSSVWSFGTGWNAGSQSSSMDVSEHWARAFGAEATLTFTGTKLEIFGFRRTNHNNFTVSIDGSEPYEANCYDASGTDGNGLLYSSEEAGLTLENTEHTATLITVNSTHPDATGAEGLSVTYARAWAPKVPGSTTEPENPDDPTLTETVMDDNQTKYWSFEEGDGKTSGWKSEGGSDKAVTEHWSNVIGATATLHFSGSELSLYGYKAPSHRYITIQIDEGEVIEIDCYAASRTDGNALLFSSRDSALMLEDKAHTAIITTMDKSNPAANATGVSITYAIAKGTPEAIPAILAGVGDEKLLDRPTDYGTLSVGDKTEWSGTAWKGDALSSKVIIASGNAPLEEVSITVSDFKNEKNDILSADHVNASWLENVSVREGRNTPSISLLREFADRISGSCNPVSIAANSLKFAWLTLNVPKDQPAGTYTGTVTIQARDQDDLELSYTLEVLDLVLENENDYELQLWQHPYSVANYYLGLGSNVSVGGICNETNDAFYFTDDHFKLMESSMKDYAAAGGHDVVASIVPEAWNHQSFYNDPTMVKWTKNTDGTWSFDYTDYDRWIEFQIKCGVIDPASSMGKIKCYSIVPWNNQLKYYDAASAQSVTRSYTPGSSDWTSIWTAFLSDFLAHSNEKGWTEITYISLDERELSDVSASASLIKSVKDENGKSFKASSALNFPSPDNYDVTDLIDDISINQGNATNRPQISAFVAHRKEIGLSTTIYTCTGDFPGSFTNSDPGDNYWSVLNSVSLGCNGFMKWAYDNYVCDMYGDSTYRYWEPGDGWFIYPENRTDWSTGQSGGFYSTPRYEMLKQGVRDACKISWLRQTERLDEEQKAILETALNAMNAPAKGTVNGAATYDSAAERAKTHSQTKAVTDAINVLSRQAAQNQSQQPEPELDYTAINQALDAAEKVEGDYTEQSLAALTQAVTDANQIKADENSTQQQIDAAAKAIMDAIDALVPVTPEPKLDYTLMNLAMSKAECILEKSGEYSKTSADQLQTLLDEGKALSGHADNQNQINACTQSLHNALLKLRLIPDSEKLTDLN